jgi:hypothetical protein
MKGVEQESASVRVGRDGVHGESPVQKGKQANEKTSTLRLLSLKYYLKPSSPVMFTKSGMAMDNLLNRPKRIGGKEISQDAVETLPWTSRGQ